jgi:HPt (histidine-containing phosphotransfer) domain-containing protein/HAMP domain-containing protein
MAPLFLLVFALFSLAVVWSVVRGVKQDAEHNLRGVAAISEAMLDGVFSTTHAVVVSAAAAFENLDAVQASERRSVGDGIVANMLDNHHIYNAWVAYEPGRFDGSDAPHASEYPGAPSGRYVRSYARGEEHEGDIIMMPDMDETSLNDPEESEWYTEPLMTKEIYNDFDHVSPYDYGMGEGELVSVTVSSPILNNGEAVGVVGGDILVRDMVLNDKSNIKTAIFSADGLVVFAENIHEVGMSMDDMRLSRLAEIREAMRNGKEIFLQDEYSRFLDEKAFIYLKPVFLQDVGGNMVYLYSAQPSSVVTAAIYNALRPIAVALGMTFLAFSTFFFFVSRQVLRPLGEIHQAIEAVGEGELEEAGAVPCLDREDEIGVLARSLNRLWQHFRLRMRFFALVRLKLEAHLAVNRQIYRSLCFEEAAKCILRELRLRLAADSARFFLLVGGRSRLFALSGVAGEFYLRSFADAPEFEGHEALSQHLEGRDYLLLKPHTMQALDLLFIAPKACSVCVLPVRVDGRLRGYIILEMLRPGQSLVHDDSILRFIAGRLQSFFARHGEEGGRDATVQDTLRVKARLAEEKAAREKGAERTEKAQRQAEQEDKQERRADAETAVLSAAREVPGLEVAKALEMLGGDADLYLEMLTLSAHELSASLDKMRAQLAQGDVRAFAVEVHGNKGALRGIGAKQLGEHAQALELAAKAAELERCREQYPAFAEALREFVAALQAILPKTAAAPLKSGRIENLRADLSAARQSLAGYDLPAAEECLGHARRFSYAAPRLDETGIAGKLEEISGFLENIEYEAADAAIASLLAMIEGGAK